MRPPPSATSVLHVPLQQQAQVISMEEDEFSTDDEHVSLQQFK